MPCWRPSEPVRRRVRRRTKAPPQKQQMPKSKASKASGKPKGVRR